MDKPVATDFNGMILLSGDARSAFCSFGYDLCTGYLDLSGKIPSNHIAALKRAYIDAQWNGDMAYFGLDSEGYPR